MNIEYRNKLFDFVMTEALLVYLHIYLKMSLSKSLKMLKIKHLFDVFSLSKRSYI